MSDTIALVAACIKGLNESLKDQNLSAGDVQTVKAAIGHLLDLHSIGEIDLTRGMSEPKILELASSVVPEAQRRNPLPRPVAEAKRREIPAKGSIEGSIIVDGYRDVM